MKAEISYACLGQSATATASEIIVFVTRQDLYRQRAKFVLDFEIGNVRRTTPPERQEKRIADRKLYYGKLMPFLYARFVGVLDFSGCYWRRRSGCFGRSCGRFPKTICGW